MIVTMVVKTESVAVALIKTCLSPLLSKAFVFCLQRWQKEIGEEEIVCILFDIDCKTFIYIPNIPKMLDKMKRTSIVWRKCRRQFPKQFP